MPTGPCPVMTMTLQRPQMRPVSIQLHVELDPNWLTLNVDPDGFTLDQVLRAIALYERKPPTRRSPKTLRNLVCSYTGCHDVADDYITKILDLTRTADPGVGEAALLLVRQLSVHVQNASRFLSHDCMQHALHILEDTKLGHLHEAAAQVIGKLACHVSLGDLWIDYMMTFGLDILKLQISRTNPQNIRYACAQCLVPLATHRNLAILLLDQATDVINNLKEINPDFKEVYAEIMTVLAQHTDYTRASVLGINSLTEALDMLKQGPCASQKQAIVLVATLAESECGLKALLEDQVLHYTLSALQDSECSPTCYRTVQLWNSLQNEIIARGNKKIFFYNVKQCLLERQVRCTALATLHNALTTPKITFQKQVLVSVDQFFHEHEEGYGLTAMLNADQPTDRSKFRLDTESRMNRAVEDLCDMVIKMVHKEARLTKNKKGQVSSVHLTPGIDLDPTVLLTLTHLAQVMLQIGHLKVNTLTFKGFDLGGNNGEEYSRIMRKSFGGINPVMVQTLVNRGATCILDVLHTYVMRIHIETGMPLPCPLPDSTKLTMQTQTLRTAWSNTNNGKPGHAALCDDAAIFNTAELKLIGALLEVAHMFAMCSCDNDLRDFEQEVRDKMDEVEGKQNAQKIKQKKDKCNRICNTKTQSAREGGDHTASLLSRDEFFFDENEDTVNRCQVAVHRSCWCNKVGSRSRPQGHLSELMDRKAAIHREATCVDKEDDACDDDVMSEAGLMFKEHLNKELGKVRRRVRLALYEGGAIEAIGPWLSCSDVTIKGIVFATLRCLIQHIIEFIEPRPTVSDVKQDSKKMRPMSAMTQKERDKALNVALFQMSSHVNSLIKDALGIPPATTQPPTAPMFTIEEGDGHPQLGVPPSTPLERTNRVSAGGGGVGAVPVEMGCELFYEDVDEDDDMDSVLPGCRPEQGWFQDIPDTARQILTLPQHANVVCANGAATRIDKMKTYSHDDYHRFARRQSRPQSATHTLTTPQVAIKLTNKSRPQSARVTGLNVSRPDSAKVTTRRPQSAASAAKPAPHRPPSARPTLAKMTQTQNATVTVSRRHSVHAVSSEQHHHPKPPGHDKRASSEGAVVCVHGARSTVGRGLSQHQIAIETAMSNRSNPQPALQNAYQSASQPDSRSASQPASQPSLQLISQPASQPALHNAPCSQLSPTVKVQVTASVRPGNRRPLTVLGTKPFGANTSRGKFTSASSSKASQKALLNVTKGMMHGQLAWKPTVNKCEPVRVQCCHRVVDVCGRIIIRDLLSRDVTVRRAAIVFLQQVIKQSESSVHMKLSECSLIPHLVDYLRINDDNVLEEVLGLVVVRLLVQSDQRLKQLFSWCGGTELLMALASSSAGLMHAEVASTLKAITKATCFPCGNMDPRSRHMRIMSAPVSRNLISEAPDIWDKIMDRWKEEDKVTALLRTNNHE